MHRALTRTLIAMEVIEQESDKYGAEEDRQLELSTLRPNT